ncbi:hypothetical protein JXI42_01690 [bacterium]|nr:hypothetical protein [bacterium]
MSKKFKAVDFQRQVREKLSAEYNAGRDAFLRELKEKYGHLRKGKKVVCES